MQRHRVRLTVRRAMVVLAAIAVGLAVGLPPHRDRALRQARSHAETGRTLRLRTRAMREIAEELVIVSRSYREVAADTRAAAERQEGPPVRLVWGGFDSVEADARAQASALERAASAMEGRAAAWQALAPEIDALADWHAEAWRESMRRSWQPWRALRSAPEPPQQLRRLEHWHQGMPRTHWDPPAPETRYPPPDNPHRQPPSRWRAYLYPLEELLWLESQNLPKGDAGPGATSPPDLSL